jgi:hypothetical protein
MKPDARAMPHAAKPPVIAQLRAAESTMQRFVDATDRICVDDGRNASNLGNTRAHLVLSAHSGNSSVCMLCEQAFDSQRSWSRRTGVSHFVDQREYVFDAFSGKVLPHYAKIFALKRALLSAAPGEWVMYVDSDVMLIDATQSIERLVTNARQGVRCLTKLIPANWGGSTCTNSSIKRANVAKSFRARQVATQCSIFVDDSIWINSGAMLLQRSCASARFLDAWWARTSISQIAADQASFQLAVLHTLLGLNTSSSVPTDKVAAMPCSRSTRDLVGCVDAHMQKLRSREDHFLEADSGRRRHSPSDDDIGAAVKQHRLCQLVSVPTLSWTQWGRIQSPKVGVHFSGAGKKCLPAFANISRDATLGTWGVPNVSEFTTTITQCRARFGLYPICCANTLRKSSCICGYNRTARPMLLKSESPSSAGASHLM